MYKLFATLSFFIRNFYLPNPFADYELGLFINMSMEPILHLITFFLVGLFYKKGSEPALGSFLYLFFYVVHTGLLLLCGLFNFAVIAVIIILILYIALLIGLLKIKNYLSYGY